MKVYLLRLAILLAAFVIGVLCFTFFRERSTPCVKLNPPNSQIQIIAKETGKVFSVKTCPH